ncbi:hypothetical protein [Arthrobacter sp. ZGTC131]|uniref:hypothetical protein n=1 Tax=Arthrobacter sp. ZGTC131 TaxID=2058898 RepID=UPI000CE3AA87|nr:hypothetical protein [Arthrobacter sp. ZGTC131]
MTARSQGPQEPQLQTGAPALRALALDGFDAAGFEAAGFDAAGFHADAFKSPSALFAALGVTEKTVMRHQVAEVILDILGATGPESEVRLRLLRHLAAHPGCPEQALLCHLRENARLPLSAVPGSTPAETSGRNMDATDGWGAAGLPEECAGLRTDLFRLPE